MEKTSLPKAWENLLASASFLPVIVKSIERFFDTSWSTKLNKHDFMEMVYVKNGSAEFEISDQKVSLSPSDILIIKPNQPHRLIVKSYSGCEFIVLNFKFLNKQNNRHSEVSLEDFLNYVSGNESGPFISIKIRTRSDIVAVLNKILKERENDEIGSDFFEYLLILELFVLISRALKNQWEKSILNKSHKLRELVNSAVDYIHNNYQKDISLSDISRYVFLSPSYFTRAFKQETGVSPINYLLNIRIQKAKELLKNTDIKILDIALIIGFSSQQRFNEIFKKYENITPLQYRKSL